MEAIITKDDANGIVRAFVRGNLDGTTAGKFEKSIIDLIGMEEKNFFIDLKETEYITSAALRSFLVIGKLLKIKRGFIAIFNIKEAVRQVFDIMNFGSLFLLCDNETAVMSEFEKHLSEKKKR